MIRNVVTRTSLLLTALLPALSPLGAEEPDLREALRDALYAEEVDRNIEKAASQYEALVSRHDAQRHFAASAIFRLAEIRRKQGRQEEAVALYQRVIREFPQAEAEGKAAREALAGAGEKVEEPDPAKPTWEEKELERFKKLAESSPDSFQQQFLNMMGSMPGPSVALVEQLISLGADPMAEGLLPAAAGSGRKDLCQLLLKAGKPSPSEAGNALAAAIRNAHTQLLAFLLEQGLAADAPAGGGESISTPLFVAIEKRSRKAVELLLKAGADPNRIVNPEWLPQQGAAEFGTSLHKALRWGEADVKLIGMLLKAGADPKIASPHAAITPLHLAVIRMHEMPPEAVKLLLAHGADPNARCTYRKVDYSNLPDVLEMATPFEVAVLENQIEMAELMLEKGADPNALDKDGLSLFISLSRQEKFRPMIRVLLEHGADPAKPGREGLSGLAEAIMRDYTDLIDLYLDGRTLDDDGELSHIAVSKKNSWELAERLIAAGSKPRPEMVGMAIAQGKWAIALRLLEGGAPTPPEKNEAVANTLLYRALTQSQGLPVAKKLIERGATPDEGWVKSGFETGNMPSPNRFEPGARSYLFRTFQLPLLETTPDIRLAGHEWQGTRLTQLAASDRVGRPLAELMLEKPNGVLRWGHSVEKGDVLTVWRKEGPAWKAAHEITLGAERAFPEVIAGDVVEVSEGTHERSAEARNFTGLMASAEWEIRRRVAFPVTLMTDAGKRQVMLRGDRLVFDPAQPEVVPFGGAREVARAAGIMDVVPSGHGAPPGVVILREGWPEMRIPFYPTTQDMRLRAGDEVNVSSHNMRVEDRLKSRQGCVGVTVPGSGWWRQFRLDGDDQLAPTLCQVAAEVMQDKGPVTLPDDPEQAAVELVNLGWTGSYLSAPDLSKIRIRRWSDGNESVIDVNLVERAASVRADAPFAEIRALDMQLIPGDIVEIPSLPAGADLVWGEPLGRLMEVAVSCRVQVTVEGGDVSMREVRYAPPRKVETAGGAVTLWPPGKVSSVMADAVMKSWNLSPIRMERDRDSGGSGRVPLEASSYFLRDGDRLFIPRPRLQAVPAPVPVPAR